MPAFKQICALILCAFFSSHAMNKMSIASLINDEMTKSDAAYESQGEQSEPEAETEFEQSTDAESESDHDAKKEVQSTPKQKNFSQSPLSCGVSTEPHRWVINPRYGKTKVSKMQRESKKLFKVKKIKHYKAHAVSCTQCAAVSDCQETHKLHQLAHLDYQQTYVQRANRIKCEPCQLLGFLISFGHMSDMKEHCEAFHQKIDFWKYLGCHNNNKE